MCNTACIDFGRTHLGPEDVAGKDVLEVGAYDVNGSLRPDVEALRPLSYLGVDLEMGPGVDLVCDAEDLLERFGPERFDVLICTEMLEHARDWRKILHNFKQVLRPRGTLLITTRSEGFPFHEHPSDFWRFSLEDMRRLFADCVIEALDSDPLAPGVFLKAKKPQRIVETDLSRYRLYSMLKRKRVKAISDLDLYWFRTGYPLLSRIFPRQLRRRRKPTIES